MNLAYSRLTLNSHYWSEAEHRIDKLPIFKGSYREKQANVVGVLGEVVAEAWFRTHNIHFVNETDKTTHDFVVGRKFTVDVKTMDRTVKPQLNFAANVSLYNHEHQRPDYYLFVSLLHDKRGNDDIQRFIKAYVVGVIDINELDRIGVVYKKDDIHPMNGTKFWSDLICVELHQLIPLNIVVEMWSDK